MASVPVYNLKKQKVGSIDLEDKIFSAEVKPHLIHETVLGQVAKRYAWKTANSFTRTDVQATGKKIYRQKGTGQARHGDIKAPIFVGGGKAHGPRPRLVSHKVNKKVRRAALISALSLHQKEDRFFVIDQLEMDKANTKQAQEALKAFGIKKALFVNVSTNPKEENFNLSVKNIKNIKSLRPEGVNVFDLMKYTTVVISKPAVEKLTERLKHV